VNLVDSSAWLEYFADGPNAGFFEAAITRKAELLVPTIVIFEVCKRVLQQRSEEEALRAVSILHAGTVVPLSGELAVRAAGVSHELKLPMADSIIFATAQTHDAVIWTQDADFRDLPRVKFVATTAPKRIAGRSSK
jgi:predicted nucleic acid-binding protein